MSKSSKNTHKLAALSLSLSHTLPHLFFLSDIVIGVEVLVLAYNLWNALPASPLLLPLPKLAPSHPYIYFFHCIA